jgi:predicted HAD superfamily Cof-like phosphohydrolase
MSLFNKQVRCPGCELKFYPRTNYVDKQFEERSSHQVAIDKFMRLGGQEVPAKPTIPSLEVRKLRAKLILEEALETIEALGIQVEFKSDYQHDSITSADPGFNMIYTDTGLVNLKEIVDGCCDLRVVTTGTLTACGVNDIRPQELVDENNLDKFKWDLQEAITYISKNNDCTLTVLDKSMEFIFVKRSDGKIIKPPSHQPPQLENEITRQSKL